MFSAPDIIMLKVNFLKSVPLLSGLGGVVLAKLGDVLETEVFSAGEHIVREATVGDTFYILASGAVSIIKDGEVIRELGQGDYFGEQVGTDFHVMMIGDWEHWHWHDYINNISLSRIDI